MTGNFFSSLTNPQTIIAILVTLAVFATLYTLIMPFFERKDFAKRMRAVSSERDLIRSRERER
ncbi:type II secretion system F family protein, partial [Rhizobium sp. BR5]